MTVVPTRVRTERPVRINLTGTRVLVLTDIRVPTAKLVSNVVRYACVSVCMRVSVCVRVCIECYNSSSGTIYSPKYNFKLFGSEK